MEKNIIILFLLTTLSCNSQKKTTEILITQKLEKCYESPYNEKDLKEFYIKNIYQMFENFLREEKYLTEISKKGYLELFSKVEKNELGNDFLVKFYKKLNFDPFQYFRTNTFLHCYGYLYEQLKIIDKKSWIYELVKEFNNFEAYGNMNLENIYLKKTIEKIPVKEFNEIVYRKIFLDLIFTKLD